MVEPFRFHVLTLFPSMFRSPLEETILGRAVRQSIVSVSLHDIREHAPGRHKSTDDAPFGGGSGMVMIPGPLVAAVEAVREAHSPSRIALLTPAGVPFTQAAARRFAGAGSLALVCGRYEGVDERVSAYVDEELSIGDFVLSGGEFAAMAVIDAVTRLIPGALGNEESPADESLSDGLLEYPQYTRPREFRGVAVPDVLLSGNHAEIARWRRLQSLERTRDRRPDLFSRFQLTDTDRKLLGKGLEKKSG